MSFQDLYRLCHRDTGEEIFDIIAHHDVRAAVLNCLTSVQKSLLFLVLDDHIPSNLTTTERQVLKSFEQQSDLIITEADKGNVVALPSDPTEQVKKSLQALLNQFASETGDEVLDHIRRYLYIISNTKCLELYELPKIHKVGVTLRPVVSSISSVTSRLCSYLKSILKQLTGMRSSDIRNSKDFCTQVRQFSTAPTDIMVSYDVKDLFISIPMAQTLKVLKDLLEADETLTQRTKLDPFHILKLVSFCTKGGNYFKLQGTFFLQKNGAPTLMGSPLSPVLAVIFMERLQDKAFTSTEPPVVPRFFRRYVDDIFAIVEAAKEKLLLGTSAISSHIASPLPSKRKAKTSYRSLSHSSFEGLMF
ncbi:hypothetical protein M514_00852 [Trichuris suis]|uniref:Reverse transcriptase domain-containing protein n=1 Tax=Trichuris suis TaxID=68888 RepID=A0A085MLJ3_9BILA|nr:hypothetical protein M513_00852 [Trichuris suis]KFD61192.1 hypothetical protein M514_00852 [Trichuris suis]